MTEIEREGTRVMAKYTLEHGSIIARDGLYCGALNASGDTGEISAPERKALAARIVALLNAAEPQEIEEPWVIVGEELVRGDFVVLRDGKLFRWTSGSEEPVFGVLPKMMRGAQKGALIHPFDLQTIRKSHAVAKP